MPLLPDGLTSRVAACRRRRCLSRARVRSCLFASMAEREGVVWNTLIYVFALQRPLVYFHCSVHCAAVSLKCLFQFRFYPMLCRGIILGNGHCVPLHVYCLGALPPGSVHTHVVLYEFVWAQNKQYCNTAIPKRRDGRTTWMNKPRP